MATETLTDLLNKIWAMYHIKLVSLKEIAQNIGVDERSVANWVTQRRRNPDGESTFKLKNFAATMTLKISKRPQLAKKYRTAFTAANILFPVGREREMRTRFSSTHWETAKISRTCEVIDRTKSSGHCGTETTHAYPAINVGWMALCAEHAKAHPEATGRNKLIEWGEQFE